MHKSVKRPEDNKKTMEFKPNTYTPCMFTHDSVVMSCSYADPASIRYRVLQRSRQCMGVKQIRCSSNF